MKLDKSTILDIGVAVLFIALAFSDVGQNVPHFDLWIPIFGIIFTLFDIYQKNKYLRNKPENEVRISSNNDSYFNVLPFILGVIVGMCSILFYFILEMENNLIIAYFVLGVVILIQGLQIIPTVVIKIEKDILEFEHGTIRKSIPMGSFNTFLVSENEIRLNSDDLNPIVLEHLHLTVSEIELTNNFLKSYIK